MPGKSRERRGRIVDVSAMKPFHRAVQKLGEDASLAVGIKLTRGDTIIAVEDGLGKYLAQRHLGQRVSFVASETDVQLNGKPLQFAENVRILSM